MTSIHPAIFQSTLNFARGKAKATKTIVTLSKNIRSEGWVIDGCWADLTVHPEGEVEPITNIGRKAINAKS